MILNALVLCAALGAIMLVLVYTVLTDSPPMPTRCHVRNAMMNAVPDLPDGVVYDLGCGWGTLIFSLARRFPDRPVIGVELFPMAWLWCLLRRAVMVDPKPQVRRADFFRVSLEDAALVVCYLHPSTMRKLAVKLERDLPDGAYVLSNTFAVPGWTPVATRTLNDLLSTRLYLYEVSRSSGRVASASQTTSSSASKGDSVS